MKTHNSTRFEKEVVYTPSSLVGLATALVASALYALYAMWGQYQ